MSECVKSEETHNFLSTPIHVHTVPHVSLHEASGVRMIAPSVIPERNKGLLVVYSMFDALCCVIRKTQHCYSL